MARPIFHMRILFAVVPSLGLAASYFAMSRFRITAESAILRVADPEFF